MDGNQRSVGAKHLDRRELVRRAAALGIGVSTLTGPMPAMAGAQATPASPVPAEEPVRIGAAVSTSGFNGVTGLYMEEAYLLWASQKNASGGLLGRPVELIVYDDESDPALCAALYERLIAEDGVDLVLGPYTSAATLAAAEVTERYGYPMLAPGGSAPAIWESGFGAVFGVITMATDYFRDIILTIAAEQGYATAAVIHEDNVFAMATARGAVAHCETAGIEVVFEETYPQQATDLSEILTRIAELDPDMLIGGSYLPDAVLIMQQARELDVSPRLFAFSVGAAQPEFLETLGDDAGYVLGPSMWEPEIATEGNREFLDAYRGMWGREPAYQAADAYASCQILERALGDIGGLDRDALRDRLFELTMTTILPGEYRVDSTGRQLGHIPLSVQWQGREKVVVTPEELSTGEVRLPTPPWDERG